MYRAEAPIPCVRCRALDLWQVDKGWQECPACRGVLMAEDMLLRFVRRVSPSVSELLEHNDGTP